MYKYKNYGGCCGDHKFFEILDEQFIVLEEQTKSLQKYQLSFDCIHDCWTVYQKR